MPSWFALDTSSEPSRRFGFPLPLLVGILFALCAGGCASEPSVRLVQWSLRAESGKVQTVSLPAHVDHLLEPSAQTYVLEASADVPVAFRGRDLALVIPHLWAPVVLSVNGHRAESVVREAPVVYRPRGPHAFTIPAEQTGDAQLKLVLAVRHEWTQSGWLDTVPYLTRAPAGDARYALTEGLAEYGNALGSGCVYTLVFTNGVLFLLQRRRAAPGWLALLAGAGGYYCLFGAGLSQRTFGHYDTPIVMFGLTIAIYSSIRFTRAQFELPGTARGWLIPIVLCAIAIVAFPGPFASTRGTAPVAVSCVGLGLIYQLWIVGRLALSRGRGETPKNAIMVLSAWMMVALCGAPDIVAWLGFGELFGGVRTTCLGLTGFALLHSAVLSRDFVAALNTGDRLNGALQEQVKRLAEEQSVVQSLNAELQHQVLVRSEQLSDALTRLVSAQGVATVLHEGDVIEQRYRVKRPLGAGGMGTVYEVERIADLQPFALKVLTGTPGVRELGRFAREAKLAAAIHHPNVVRVFDAAIGQNGFLFVVFEYVDGEPLSAQRKRFGDLAWALQVLRGVARGLTAIHALGIAHRDLKPANVLVRSDASGRPLETKITDFGVSNVATPASATSNTSPGSAPGVPDLPTVGESTHATVPAASDASSTPPLSLTKVGTILGTPVYMAPEAICEGHLPLVSSDVYSFGVVAFELLTARRPFTEAEAVARAYGYFAGAAPTFEGLGLSPMLQACLARALAVDPAHRPTASEVAESIDSFCDTSAGG